MEYLTNTFEPRVKAIQEEQDLEYYEVNTIRNWLRKNPEETMVISFLEQVETLKRDVELNQAKVETLGAMLEQIEYNKQRAIDNARDLEER